MHETNVTEINMKKNEIEFAPTKTDGNLLLASRLPMRVQRRRTKGYKLPFNTKCVTRGTKWGNPFIVGKHGTRDECLIWFEYLCHGYIMATNNPSTKEQKKLLSAIKNDLHELKGNNLACFCKLESPCHADVLLALANRS
jgi:hypothetical protein